MLIRHFQIYGHVEDEPLLSWVNAQIPDQKVKNFTTDWNDGKALCALVDYIQPGLCPDHASLDPENKLANCKRGIKLAEEKLEIMSIIEPDDLCDPEIDAHCVVTYVSSFCKPANKALLKWIQGLMPNRKIKNLCKDWRDGINLACLLYALFPRLLPNYDDLDNQNTLESLTDVMEAGEQCTGIKPPQKLLDGILDELSMSTYLVQFWHARSIPNEVVCTGLGLTKAFLGNPATFEVTTTKHGAAIEISDLNVSIVDSKNKVIKPHITPSGKGCFQVVYTAESLGQLKMDIKWKRLSIQATPFTIDVVDMKIKDWFVTVGSPILVATNGINEIGDLEVSLKNMSDENVFKADNIMKKEEGIIECSFKTTPPGNYKVAAKLSGVEIPRSLNVEIVDRHSAQQYSVRMRKPASGNRLTINKAAVFDITPSHADFSHLVAKVQTPGTSEPKQITLIKENGSIIGKFSPSEGGSYEVVVTCAGENITGSPINVTAVDLGRCRFIDKLPRFVQAGHPCSVNLSTKGAGAGNVKVTSSQADILTVLGESDVDSDIYTIRLIPNKVGESTVDVKFDEVSLLRTPLTMCVCDASKCIASGTVIETGRAKCNKPFDVSVETKGAGKGKLAIKLHHEQTTYTGIEESNKDGTYRYSVTSFAAGTHSLEILWNDVHISNSPFPVKVISDADQFVAKGDGLKEAVAHKAAKVTLKGPQSGLLDEDLLNVWIRDARFESKTVDRETFDPSSEEALVCVTDNQRGSYSIDYSVPYHGNYTLYITVDQKPIPSSPFNVRVYPAFNPSKCKVFGQAIDNPYSLVLGKSIEFKVDTTDAGAGTISATATDPTNSELPVTIAEDKSTYSKKIYVLKLDPNVIGEHKVNVCWNEGPISDYPLTFEVGDPTKVHVLNLPAASTYIAEVKKPLKFTVDSRAAGKGQLECTVKTSGVTKGDKTCEVAVEPKLQEDGTFLFTFTPQKVGQMQLFLTYNGESVLPAAWECEIGNPVPTQVTPLTPNLCGKQSENVRFVVSGLTGSVTKNMKISVLHLSQQKEANVQREKEHGSSRVYHFMPEYLGEYEVNVKVNDKDIHGSPFQIKIVNPDACTVQGEVPTTLYLPQSKQFFIDTSEAGPGDLIFETDDPHSTNRKLSCAFNLTSSGTTQVEVEGLEPGKCKVWYKWGGYDIPNMPVEFTIFDPQRCHFTCKQMEDGNIKTTDKVSFGIDTTAAGCCQPTVVAEGPTANYPIEIEEIENGNYKASFTPGECGLQTVTIFIGEVMLPKCPLIFNTSEDETTLQKRALESQEADTSQQQDKLINGGAPDSSDQQSDVVIPGDSTDRPTNADEQDYQTSDEDDETHESIMEDIEHKDNSQQGEKRPNHWKTAFFVLAASILLPLLLIVIVMLGYDVTDPIILNRPI